MPDVSLVRLYTLRLSYLILALGIGIYFWPAVIHHDADFALSQGIRYSLLAAIGLLAVLGLRYPVRMIPLLLFEITWKTIYLLAFALRLWTAHQLTPVAAQDVQSVLMVVIFLPLIPWGFVWKRYILAAGDRWTSKRAPSPAASA